MAGNARFHDKIHSTNHHTLSTSGFPDSATDPIASPERPFKGDFIVNGVLSSSNGLRILSADVEHQLICKDLTVEDTAYIDFISGGGTEVIISDGALTGQGNYTLSLDFQNGVWIKTPITYITNNLLLMGSLTGSDIKLLGDANIAGDVVTTGDLTASNIKVNNNLDATSSTLSTLNITSVLTAKDVTLSALNVITDINARSANLSSLNVSTTLSATTGILSSLSATTGTLSALNVITDLSGRTANLSSLNVSTTLSATTGTLSALNVITDINARSANLSSLNVSTTLSATTGTLSALNVITDLSGRTANLSSLNLKSDLNGFNAYLSSINLSGNIGASTANLNNLNVTSNATVTGNLLVYGNLSSLGDVSVIETNVLTTSSLSVVNSGTNSGLLINQLNSNPIANFKTNSVDVFVINSTGAVVYGTLSSNGNITSPNLTNLQNTSGKWDNASNFIESSSGIVTSISSSSASWLSGNSNLNFLASSINITNTLTASSATFNNLGVTSDAIITNLLIISNISSLGNVSSPNITNLENASGSWNDATTFIQGGSSYITAISSTSGSWLTGNTSLNFTASTVNTLDTVSANTLHYHQTLIVPVSTYSSGTNIVLSTNSLAYQFVSATAPITLTLPAIASNYIGLTFIIKNTAINNAHSITINNSSNVTLLTLNYNAIRAATIVATNGSWEYF